VLRKVTISEMRDTRVLKADASAWSVIVAVTRTTTRCTEGPMAYLTFQNYKVVPLTVVYFPEKPSEKKGGEATRIRVTIKYIYFECLDTGYVWRFTGVKRKGFYGFRDSRDNRSYTISSLTTELTRLTSERTAQKILEEMHSTLMKGNEYRSCCDYLIERLPKSEAREWEQKHA
jgi:hypothetical protein